MPTSIRSGSAQSNSYIRYPTINLASFKTPTTLGSITIEPIVGAFSSYIVQRTGGSEGTFTSPSQSGYSYTDPTVLSLNTQYTYTITPYRSDGRVGFAFFYITNPNSPSTPGKVFTLTSAANVSPVLVNTNGSRNSVYMTWTNIGYTSIAIQNTTIVGGTITAFSTTTVYDSSDKDPLVSNTRYTYAFRARNGDGVTNPIGSNLVTCTWATPPTLTYDGDGSSTTAVSFSFSGGAYTNLSIQTTLGVNLILRTASPYTTAANTYAPNTQKTYFVCPINLLGYYNNVNFASVVTCTWATPPTLTYAGATSSMNSISFSFSGGSFASLSVQTTLGDEVTKVITSPYVSETNFYSPNQTATYYACPVNALGYYNVSNYASVLTCTWASVPTLTYYGDGSSTSAVSFSFIEGAYTNLSVQTTLGTEISKTTTSPYVSPTNTYGANIQKTYYVVPLNALGYGNVTNYASVLTCTWGSPPTLAYAGATSSINKVSFSFTGGSFVSLSAQTILGREITRVTSSPYTSPSSYSVNQTITYYVCPVNALGYYNVSNYASVSTCTWASGPTLTYSGAGSSMSAVSFSFTGGNYTDLSVQTTLGSEIVKTKTSPYVSPTNTYGANSQITYYVVPLNALGYGDVTNYKSVLTCTWASVPTLTYAGATSSLSAISFSFSGGSFASLSVQTTLGTEVVKVTASPYVSATNLYSANQTVTYYVCPVNALGYYNVSNYASVSTGTWASAPTLTYFGAGSSTNQIGFSFSGGSYTNLSVQTPLGTELAMTTTSPYKSASLYSANQSITYYVCPINSFGYSNVANYSSVATCTWATCNTPTFSGTIATGTTLNCTGTFSRVYITYAGTANPATGTTVVGTNSIGQAYTGMTASTAYTFTCAPINALNYRSSNGASGSVTTVNSSSGVSVTVSGGTLTDYYPFELSSGSTLSAIINGTTNSNAGTLVNSASLSTTSKIQTKSLNCPANPNSGSNTNYAMFTTVGMTTTGSNNYKTVCMWIYPRSLVGGGSSWIYCACTGTSAWGQIAFGLQIDAYWIHCVGESATTYSSIQASNAPLNRWTHVAVTFFVSSGYNKVTFFINGKLMNATSNYSNVGMWVANNKSISRITVGNYPYVDPNFDGQIDDFRLYNGALTQTDITAIYNAR